MLQGHGRQLHPLARGGGGDARHFCKINPVSWPLLDNTTPFPRKQEHPLPHLPILWVPEL